ncbi:MAG: NAD+ synthase [Ignavibacteriaceae bacterium]|nr:NAD+ synthase [Ignavibacteriaceae bacterium]
MKIALCQINPIIGDIEGNKEKILSGYKKGIEDKVDLVIFPELALIGYSPQDLVEKKEFRDAVIKASNEIAEFTTDVGLIFGAITEDEDNVGTNIFNSALLCYKGKIRLTQNKTLIPNYDVFDEIRYFESAKDTSLHHFKGEVLGISICEDIWNDKDYWKKRLYQHDPVEKLVKQGATLLINISASPYSYGKRFARKEMLSTLTKEDALPLVYCCLVGAQTELIFDGASMCFNDKGELKQLGKKYEEDYLIFDTSEDYSRVENVEASFEEEVYSALVLGVKDYCKKLNFKKVLIGLSGGIDSALVTAIAVEALGKENVEVVLLPSKYSSEGSVNDSLKLISNLGISHKVIPIQDVVDNLIELLAPSFEGKNHDTTEENLQSRSRGIILMAIANKHGHLLLTTGNKSEMAVGYATLYGDMCGGLGVIADVYKTDVYRLAEFINRDKEIIPQEIIEKAPSAELKPNQTDQDTLPPYDLLDSILRMYLENNKEFNEISQTIGDSSIVGKVLRMVDFNEFKRRQAAPALRISNKAFGYGRRYPIVQGWRK